MHHLYPLGAVALLLTVGAAESRYDWSTADLSYAGGPGEFAETRGVCAKLIHAEPPLADRPTASERRVLKGCDSEKLYYGIGMVADPVKARKCAIIEREQITDQEVNNYFVAQGTLMTVYANGRGANRNFDVAIHMACQLEDAPAATDARIKALLELKRTGWTGDGFSPCDDATSGVSGGFCAGHDASLAQQSRTRRIERLAQRWTVQQHTLFNQVYKDFTNCAEAAHEMDCYKGTLQAGCTIGGREDDVEEFLKRIEALSWGKAPTKKKKTDETGINPVTEAKDWQDFLASVDKDDRAAYVQNERETRVARQKFERELVAFARSAFPQFTSHQIRQIFADL